MARYLTLSRAARLAGVKRGALQTKISQGELPTFEGMIELGDLLRAYPETEVDDTTELQRVDRIKMKAVPRTMRDRGALPDIDTLHSRLEQLSRELARSRTEAAGLRDLFGELQQRLEGLGRTDPAFVGLKGWLGEGLGRIAALAPTDELVVRDSLLRVMTAHVFVYPSGHDYFVEGSDNILEAGLRAGLALPYGCSDGSCGGCKARLLAGKVKPVRAPRYTMPPGEQREGMLLLCCHTAVSDVEIEAIEALSGADLPRQEVEARVSRISRPNERIVVVDLKTPPDDRLRFLAGQYVLVRAGDSQPQALAIASCPCDDRQLQFHIARDGSPLAEYAWATMTLADRVQVQGPAGDFILDTDSPRSLVFIAWDEGFAPIKSLVENAFALDAAEHVHLYWLHPPGEPPYMHNLCRSWQDALDGFSYTPWGMDAADPAALDEVLNGLVEAHPDLAGQDFYLCAPPALTARARAYLQARGVPRDQLRAQSLTAAG